MNHTALVRYGRVSEVAKFECDLDELPARGDAVVIQTHRGLELGTLLNVVSRPSAKADEPVSGQVLRRASSEDQAQAEKLQAAVQDEFSRWLELITEWDLKLELIDLEWTLDRQKLILYVLTDRGPESTKLALQAAAAGLAAVDVQPVGPEGLISIAPSGGGCGSGGGGCGSGGCH